jgi:hypothetical protein
MMKAFIKKIFFTLPLLALAIVLQAQQPEQILKASGSPANPKVPVSWNRYNDYAAITEICKKLANAYPDLVKLESMGKSHLGKEMWVMTISDFKKGDPGRKPAMYIDGNIHSNESIFRTYWKIKPFTLPQRSTRMPGTILSTRQIRPILHVQE